MGQHTKTGAGGARRKIDPKKGAAKPFQVSLYQKDRDYLVKKYGSLSKAIKTLIPAK